MRFNKFSFIAAAAFLCSTSFLVADSAVITGALQHEIKYNDGPHSVIVYFSDENAPSILSSDSATKPELIRGMKKHAKESQRSFLANFSTRVEGLRTYWLVNGAAMVASEELINTMAQDPSVREITLDGEVSLPPTRVEKDTQRGKWTYGLEKIGIPEVRSQYGLTGKGVVLGIIDTGCAGDHKDLAGKVIAFKDFVNNKDEKAYDDQGHGSHCSGTMVGGDLSGTQIGVAPEAKIVVAKALGGEGGGTDSVMIASMEWMADPDGNADTDDAPVVVNCSWGANGDDRSMVPAVQAWIKLNIFPCFAAGNSGPRARTVGIPGGYLESFAVGSTTSSDKASYFSSRGPVSWDGVDHIKPDVSAPGSDIYSVKNTGGYTKLSGTSMACPHVAGVIGLLHEAKPGISIAEVREILECSAKDLGTEGKDTTYGSGRIDVPAAIAKALLK